MVEERETKAANAMSAKACADIDAKIRIVVDITTAN